MSRHFKRNTGQHVCLQPQDCNSCFFVILGGPLIFGQLPFGFSVGISIK